jgi:hypothetical protein
MKLKGSSRRKLGEGRGGPSGSTPFRSEGGEARPREWWPKATQGGGHQTRVHLDQMVLVRARVSSGPKALKVN